MKLRYFSVFMVFLSFILTSCGGDSEEESILGTWKLTELSASGCTDQDFANAIFEFSADDGLCFTETDGSVCINLCITFNADATVLLEYAYDFSVGGIMFNDRNSETGSWTQMGNDIEICDEDGDCQILDRSGSNSFDFSQFDEDLMCSVMWTLNKQ